MLKGIDPLLGPEVLRALAAMGHGDEIALVDANFPAESVARGTVTGTGQALKAAKPEVQVIAVEPKDSPS